jgi:solute carrier family 50 protein (sugar transporter)
MAPWAVDPAVRNIIALVGSVAVTMLWLAPVRDVWRGKTSIWATKSTALVATAFGYVAGLFNCILWNMYAVTRLDNMTVPFLVNTAGFFLNLSFVVCYWMYASGKPKTDTRNQFAALFVVWLFAVFIWVSTGSNETVGYIAALVNILMLFGPLAAAGQVIKSRSTRGMPFPPLVLTFVSSFVWFFYGLYILEVPVMIPNGLGMVFGILQLSLYFWASRQEKKNSTVREDETGFEPIDSHANGSFLRESSTASIGILRDDETGPTSPGLINSVDNA